MKLLATLVTLFVLTLAGHPCHAHATRELHADIIIYGGTSAGVIAACAARKCGKTAILVEPGRMLGGMTSGGLGKTDAGNKNAITGLARRFYQAVGEKYGLHGRYQWVFEPHVAEAVFLDYAGGPGITVLMEMVLGKVTKQGKRIRSVTLRGVGDSSAISYRLSATEFLDCTYEGDLMAMAGVSYTLGREANSQYGETLDGVQLAHYHQFPDGVDPYRVAGDPSSGLLWGISADSLQPPGTGDKKIQAYNFRICLTDSAANRIPITRPPRYDASRYELLLRVIAAQPGKRSLNNYFIWSKMPNRKTDVNNRGAFSTDMIGMNYGWPEGDYETRQRIFREHLDYTRGLLYFWGHDPRVADTMRRQMLRWGYAKDEYQRFGHFTPALYIREGRRMLGRYVMTEHNCDGTATVDDGIAFASYNMDSHNTQRIVINGMVKNEGDVEVHVPHPFPIAYRAITPKAEECVNLLVPVCLSATHIAYGSIRMEPVFMALGQAAAVAASLAIDGRKEVQQVDAGRLKQILTEDPYLDSRRSH